MSTLTLNAEATKRMWCPSCKENMTFGIHANAWCCEGCSWVKEFTKSDMKFVHSQTIKLAEYLRTIGYPVLKVEPEREFDCGVIVLIDTNPTADPKKARKVLTIQVEREPATKKKPAGATYTVHAVKYTTNRKVTGNTVFFMDDMMNLGTDELMQLSMARLVAEDLNLQMPHTVFDMKLAELRENLVCAKIELADAEKALANYIKEGRKNKA